LHDTTKKTEGTGEEGNCPHREGGFPRHVGKSAGQRGGASRKPRRDVVDKYTGYWWPSASWASSLVKRVFHEGDIKRSRAPTSFQLSTGAGKKRKKGDLLGEGQGGGLYICGPVLRRKKDRRPAGPFLETRGEPQGGIRNKRNLAWAVDPEKLAFCFPAAYLN